MNRKSVLAGIQIRDVLQAGDLGYLTYLHAKIYKEECGYDLEFEGYVSKTFYDFTQRYAPERDRFFLAEKDGKMIGSIAILGHSDTEAQLRWFLILPEYRGIGLGKELFSRAMDYCRDAKFKHIWLLTTSDQEKASTIYIREGFCVTEDTSVEMWGRELVEKKLELFL